MALITQLHNEIVEIGTRLWQRGMIAGSDGNISARLNHDSILITPAGVAKGKLDAGQLVTVDNDGNKISGNGRPSSEKAMHLIVYERRSDICACVHSHAPNATAFAVTGIEPDQDVLAETVMSVGRIPLVPYALPGSDALAKSLALFVEKYNAFLLENHGLLTVGRTLEEAYRRHEVVEHYAGILIKALRLGPVKQIPPEDVARLENLRREMNSQLSGNQQEGKE